MANDAFMAGFNQMSKKNKGTTDDDSDKSKSGGKQQGGQQQQGTGGLPGMIQRKLNAPKTAQGQQAIAQTTGPNKPTIQTSTPEISAVSLKRGGKIKRGGLAFLHRGETVVPAKHSRRKRSGGIKQRTIIKG